MHCTGAGRGAEADKLHPQRAPVVPRVRTEGDGAALPIDKRVAALLARGSLRAVNLVGPAGAGKSIALEHLRAVMGPQVPLALIDGHIESTLPTSERPTIFTTRIACDPQQFTIWHIAPWTEDDLIEYLLATHPGRCRAVMDRIMSWRNRQELHGSPELWRIVLDELAADDAVRDLSMALERFLARELIDPQTRDLAKELCLIRLASCGRPPGQFVIPSDRIERLIAHRAVQVELGAHRLASELCAGEVPKELSGDLPPELLERVARLIGPVPAAISNLDAITRSPATEAHAMAASLLVGANSGWRPTGRRIPKLAGARLSGAFWPGIRLAGADLSNTILNDADLSGADLTGSQLQFARLAFTLLRAATLRQAKCRRAELINADLSDAVMDEADLWGANLTSAILNGASLKSAILSCNLTNAAFRGANLNQADLEFAKIEGADFSGAELTAAKMNKLPLKHAKLDGTCLSMAELAGCDLEEACASDLDCRGATLDGALFTGSVLRGANFRKADLRNCGLADIDWQGADLRQADLGGATFHMGSTRSGLVGSDIPGEGSRTGFYTDDYYDRDFKPPQEIRKANLCGADLRGANIDGVDFYLVDLRKARYTPSQGEYLTRSGAILCS